MIRSKQFVFLMTIAVVFLLTISNWVTSVKASSTGFTDATPIPTAMFTKTPDPTEEILSQIEQNELKKIIYAYFDLRYRALSVSNSEDFKRNGFGDLISDMYEDENFLQEELSKLAVDIKHAELNRLRYADYKYFLDFSSITLDRNTQTVTVSVIEDNEVVYERSVELNPEEPTVSHQYNIVHTITLQKDQSKWEIISDKYVDNLWKALRQEKKSTGEILRATVEMISNMKASPRTSSQSGTTSFVFADELAADTSTHPYDRARAVEYALKHAKSYNPVYPDYNSGDDALPWGDCTNFVSQAIYEGGNASMFIPSPLPDPNTNGQSGWYFLNDMQRASA